MPKSSNIYLVGMMGSGKSVTGKRLAVMLDCLFVDLDELIQEKTRRTIVDIFEKEGEEFFRNLESSALKEVSGLGPKVIATGGGTVLRPENIVRMHDTGKICFLETSVEVLWDRVKWKKDRPLLRQGDPKKNLEKIFEIRSPLYLKVSDLEVHTDGRTAQDVAQEIFDKLGNTNESN